jgi:hypothetical protein
MCVISMFPINDCVLYSSTFNCHTKISYAYMKETQRCSIPLQLNIIPCFKTLARLNITAFWDIAPCSLVDVDLRFKGAYCVRHQGVHHCPDDGGSTHL